MADVLAAGSDAPERTVPAHDAHSRRRVLSETLLSKCGELAATVLLVVLVPRLLGPSGYGQFAVASGAVSLAALTLGLGIPLAAVRFVPASSLDERLAVARALATRAALTRGRVLALLSVVTMLCALLVPGIPIIAAVSVCVAMTFSVGSSIVAEVALAVGYRRIWNVRYALESTLIVCAAVAGYAASGVRGAIVGLPVATAATFALLSPPVLAALRRARPAEQLPVGVSSYARQQTLSSLIFMTVLRASPLAVAALGGTSRQVGYSAIATGVTAGGAGIVGSLMDVQLPRLSEAARTSLSAAERETASAALGTLGLAVAFSIVGAILAPKAIELGLGRGFDGARDAVTLGIAAVPLATVSALAGLKSSLRLCPGRFTWAWACGGGAFIAVLGSTVPGLAAKGAAMAVLASLITAGSAATALLRDRALSFTLISALGGTVAVLGAGMLGGAL